MISLNFEKLLKELDEPHIDGWKKFCTFDEISVWRKSMEDKSVFEYKVYGRLDHLSTNTLISMFFDAEYRKHWDKYVKEIYNFNDGNKEAVYLQVAYPAFISNRDYVFTRQRSNFDIDGVHYELMVCDAYNTPKEILRKNVIRVTDSKQYLICKSDGHDGVKFLLWFYEDSKGKIPKAFWNWATKFGAPTYIKHTVNACRNYDKWLELKHKGENAHEALNFHYNADDWTVQDHFLNSDHADEEDVFF